MGLIFDCWCWDLVVIATSIFLLIFWYFKTSYSYWKSRNIPYKNPSFPFGNIGDILLFRRVCGEVYEDAYKHKPQEKLCGIFLVLRPAVVIRDPETIKSILVKDFTTFHDRGMYFNEDIDPLSAHLFFLNGLRWKNLRSKLTPTFTSGKMKMMFQTLFDCGNELQYHLKESANNKDTVEIKDILARFTTDVIASCAFGIKCNCLKNPDAEFRRWGRKFFQPDLITLIGILLNFMVPSLAKVLKIRSIAPGVANFFQTMVNETVEVRETKNITRNDFMQLLIELKNKGYVDSTENTFKDNLTEIDTQGTHNLTMNEIGAQVFVFFIAGFETSSTTMSFCLYELACNPLLQDKLRQEIDAVLAKNNGEITYDSLQQMEYLDRVIAETLRKYPPVSLLNRECNKEYRVPDSDIVLEAGTSIIIPVQALHHDPQYYPNPDRFDPERFTEEEKAKRNHYTYLPFGEGPRICIGMRFGLMQTKVGLTSLLRRYKFQTCDKTPIPLVLDPKSFILAATEGIYLQILDRNN